MMPLIELQTGQQGVVRDLHGGRGFKSRLATLGFTPGAPVRMMRNSRHGPIIVSVRGTQIALGRGEAQRVLIVKAEDRDVYPTHH